MDLFEDEELVPKTNKIEKTKEPEKSKMTKEEIAKFWREYYAWIKTIYPIDSFEIQGKNGEKLYFHRGNPWPGDKYVANQIFYFLRDNNYKQVEAQIVERNLRGEEPETQEDEDKSHKVSKASITIDRINKRFSFQVDWDYQRNGYGRAIYDNYMQILELLGIEDKEQYELQVANQANHIFLKNMHTRELVARTNVEPSIENARAILEEFAQYPNTVSLRDVNAIVYYAKKSNVPREEISQALNQNGFNIHIGSIADKQLEQFKAFGITGLKATCMHHHFMESESFEFMQLITNADPKDTTLEFRRIFEEIKKQREEKEKEGKYLPDNLKKFGELVYIILDWRKPALLFRDVTPEIKKVVRDQAINKFEEFDPEHNSYWALQDQNSLSVLTMLRDAGLMDKDAYIALYQKSLNRNYDLAEFDRVVADMFIDKEFREQARQEIFQNVYYPYPKKNWQKSSAWGEHHRISRVVVPKSIREKGRVRDILKQEILNRGVAKTTKIKTDMLGVRKDGKTFVVDNLKDWLFGVPGAHGNLQMMGNDTITFPPQTPKFAVDMVEEILNGLVYPGAGEGRDD